MARALLLAVLAAVMVGVSGCVGVGAGISIPVLGGQRDFDEGVLSLPVDADMEAAAVATQKGLADLDISVTSRTDDPSAVSFTAKAHDGTPVVVTAEHEGLKTTRLHIRVGSFGDETSSRIVYDAIAARL